MIKKIKLTDYLAYFLKRKKIINIFAVIGGANVHIIDSLSKVKENKIIFNHHEQASAFAAQASSRVKNVPSVCVTTTGPAGTNAMTGLLSAWQDSIPTIFISGQSRSQIIKNAGERRQFGNQGFKISELVKKMTKKSVTVYDPKEFHKILESCYKESISGRPGPVWIDIPLDIQGAKIQEYVDKKDNKTDIQKKDVSNYEVDSIVNLISKSKKPLFKIGRAHV